MAGSAGRAKERQDLHQGSKTQHDQDLIFLSSSQFCTVSPSFTSTSGLPPPGPPTAVSCLLTGVQRHSRNSHIVLTIIAASPWARDCEQQQWKAGIQATRTSHPKRAES